MNKVKALLIFSLFISLLSCSSVNTSSSLSTSEESTSYESLVDETSSVEELKVNYEIVYKFENGEILKKLKGKRVAGEILDFVSPQYPFLKASIDRINEVVGTNDIYYEVIYSYSDIGETELDSSIDYDEIMFDKNKGISFTYIISGRTSKWDDIIVGNNFAINIGRFKLFDSTFEARWKEYTGSMAYGVGREALLTSEKEEILVTFSISTKGISLYKNGKLHYSWGNRLYNAEISGLNYNKMVQDFTSVVFDEISSSGFKVGGNIKEVKLDYAVNEERAKEIYDNYVVTSVKYLDDYNHEIESKYVNIDHGGNEYSIISPTIPNYHCSDDLVEGITNEDKEIVVRYTNQGTEKLSSNQVLDKTNRYEWGNTSTWISVANNLKNDFSVSVKYHNEGIRSLEKTTNVDDYRWRTGLNIVTDGTTNNFWVTRLDWMGWFSGNQIGNNEKYSSDYFANINDDLYPVYKDCYVYVNYIRRGNTLDIIGFIEPINENYKNNIYKYKYQLNNLNTNNISIYLTSEDAKLTLMSVKY